MSAPTHEARPDDSARAELLLADHRAAIDRLDAVLVYALAERFAHTRAVGQLKAQHALPPSDPDREARQAARLDRLSQDAGLDPAFARQILEFIIAEVIRQHQQHQKT